VLLLVEGSARGFAPQLPEWRANDPKGVIMSGHPTRLWGMSEGVKQNIGATANVNELGFRGPIPELPRDEGHQRIIVLGDSSFFGHGVEDNETMEVVLELHLQREGIDVDVVNAGIPGYSTEQALLWLEDEGWDLDPTLLLLGTLWSDTNWDAFRDKDLLKSRRFARLNPLASSAAFRLIVGWVGGLLQADGGQVVVWSQRDGWPSTGMRRVPIRDYAENLEKLIFNAKDRGVGAMFVAPTAREDMARLAAMDEKQRDQGAKALWTEPCGDEEWDPYFEVQRRVASLHQLPLADMSVDYFERVAQPSRSEPGQFEVTTDGLERIYMDMVHPTVLGHLLLGSRVGQVLLESGWPSDSLITTQDRAEDWTGVAGFDDRWLAVEQQGNPLSPHVQLFEGVDYKSVPVDPNIESILQPSR